MRGSRKFCQSYKSRKFCHRYKWAIIGPPAKRHWNGVLLAGLRCWGSRPVLWRNPTFLRFLQGGGGPDHLPPPPPSDPHMRPKIKRSSWFWLTGPVREICLRGSSFGVSDHVRLESNCWDRRTCIYFYIGLTVTVGMVTEICHHKWGLK